MSTLLGWRSAGTAGAVTAILRCAVLLRVVPARVHGRSCGASASLEITQRFQRFSATLASAGAAAPAAQAFTRAGNVSCP